jgi:hypothetical protein
VTLEDQLKKMFADAQKATFEGKPPFVQDVFMPALLLLAKELDALKGSVHPSVIDPK